MAINTRSAFLYGHLITEQNFALDFDEGGGELQASLDAGDYTLGSIATEVAKQLNDTGALTYTVSIDRSTRKITISASGTFSLLAGTGTRTGVDVFSLLGFTATDKTGASSYEAENASGTFYQPQFKLQDYVPLENLQGASQASVNESASGVFQIISFGSVRNMRCNIRFITDRVQGPGAPIENNASAVSQARAFLSYITGKNKIEFYPDRSDTTTFQNLLLESTRRSREGISFELRELLGQNLPGFYETGLLTFREITP